MFDTYNERRIVNFDKFNFVSNRFEIWSAGAMVDSGNIVTEISILNTSQESHQENKIAVSINSKLNDTILAKNLNFDIAYTNNDRILLGIIPQASNCDDNESFAAFVNFAPIRTRVQKTFKNNEPHACSLFLTQSRIEKITFSIALSKMLIEFYK